MYLLTSKLLTSGDSNPIHQQKGGLPCAKSRPGQVPRVGVLEVSRGMCTQQFWIFCQEVVDLNGLKALSLAVWMHKLVGDLVLTVWNTRNAWFARRNGHSPSEPRFQTLPLIFSETSARTRYRTSLPMPSRGWNRSRRCKWGAWPGLGWGVERGAGMHP